MGVDDFSDKLSIAGSDGAVLAPTAFEVVHTDYYDAAMMRTGYADGSVMISAPSEYFAILMRPKGEGVVASAFLLDKTPVEKRI